MKKLSTFLLFVLFGWAQAQYSIEENNIAENFSEQGRNLNFFKLEKPLEYFRLRCNNPKYANYPSGEESFRVELSQKMRYYLDSDSYFVNGYFFLHLTIDSSGIVQLIKLTPEVKNGDLLRRDIEFALKKIKTPWQPALCNGNPVNSNVRLRINFSNLDYDL